MGIDGVDFGDLHVEGVRGRPKEKVDATDANPSRADKVGDGVDRRVEGHTERRRKAVDQRLSAAGFGVVLRALRRVLRHVGQEGAARRVVGHEHPLDPHILQIRRKLPDVIIKAGRFQQNGPAVLFHDENLVVDRVVGLVGVQPDGAAVVDMHFTLFQLYGPKSIFVHCNSLLCLLGVLLFWCLAFGLLRSGRSPQLPTQVYRRTHRL